MPSSERHVNEIAFKIHGMDCAEEVAILKRAVAPLVGGEERLSFDMLNGKMVVALETPGPSIERVLAAVASAGMQAEVWQAPTGGLAEKEKPSWRSRRRTLLSVGSGAALLAGLFSHAWVSGSLEAAFGTEGLRASHGVPLVSRSLYGLGIVAAAWSVLPRALFALRRLRPDMNLLMTVAVLGAMAIGEWFEAATVSFLFSVSLALESWSVGCARRAVAALLDLTPLIARVRQADGSEEGLPVEQVSVGAVVVIKPGERIPVDGRVRRGTSEVNQAPLTGESVPVSKDEGDQVLAGTLNGDGALEVECTRVSRDTTLAHVVRLVAEAQRQRAPSEQWVDTFARIYTPLVMALALAVLVLPPLVFEWSWTESLYRALVLLVIGCPCALVISTPVSIVAALAAAARNGVLIKGGAHVESPARLKAMAFDKTGTLTLGRPAVVDFLPLSGHDERELLERVAALEARSEHPIARAIVAFAAARGVNVLAAADLQVVQGKGAVARFNDKTYWVGSHRYLAESGLETEEIHRQLESFSAAGRTVVGVWNQTHVCGLIAVADAVRPEARQVLEALRRAGIEHLAMLTGDNEGTARVIARELGITEVRAGLLPADKVAAVESLVAERGSLAMVGDGVNDAPALARATLSIAMGNGGSDAAIEAADIALMTDDLGKLPWLISHSRRTLGIIRANIALSLSVKALFVALTLLGHASLWSAIAADMGASLLVVFNGLRLLGSKE